MKNSSILYLGIMSLLLGACVADPICEMSQAEDNIMSQRYTPENEDLFATKNGEETLTGAIYDIQNYAQYCNDPAVAEHVCKLLLVCDTTLAESLYNMNITEEQLEEIANFVNESILTTEKTQKEKMISILKWIRSNIKYEYGDQNAYSVFQNKIAICQGYSNLMCVMLHTQGIKATIANGYLVNAGGHAWNYALADGTWYVLDPTNRSNAYAMEADLESYRKTLQPWTIAMPLLDDGDFVYDFRDKHFNIRAVKSNKEQVSVPFGALGYRTTAFDPIDGINKAVKEIYLSLNIRTIGEYVMGLKTATT